jgi:uncharacterized membrane protein YbhN (UPF0104 family)
MKKLSISYIIKALVSIAILVVLYIFIKDEIQKNGVEISKIGNDIKWYFFILAINALMLYFLISSLALRYLLNKDSFSEKLSVKKVFGVLNISGLVKYIPGKVWSYAVLFYALTKKGFALSKVIFDCLIHLILTVTSPFIFMVPISIYLIVPDITNTVKVGFIVAFFIVYSLCLFFFPQLLNIFIGVMNRFVKNKVEIRTIERKTIFKAQIMLIIAYLVYVLSSMLVIYSLDRNIDVWVSFQLAVICVFSTLIGFLAIFVPGGVGVQESLIYMFMNISQSDTSLSIALPVAYRMVSFITDILIGLFALWIIRKEVMEVFKNKRKESL